MKITNNENVLTIKLDEISVGWHQDILLVSDQHHDSPLCNRKLEKAQLDEAISKNALIFFGGDTFDAMQGRRDPRSSYDNLDPELKTDKYFEALVDFNAKFYAPYANNIVMMAHGNHETSVIKHHNIDLLDRMIYKINKETGSTIYAGGYGGWVRFLFTIHRTSRSSLNMKYYHGSGGESPVTKGVIQTARQAVYLPDADIVWNGHNHNEYSLPIQRERLSESGTMYTDTQWHVRTPGYKNDYGNGSGGWAVEAGMTPKPQGCIWLHMFYENSKIRVKAIQDIR